MAETTKNTKSQIVANEEIKEITFEMRKKLSDKKEVIFINVNFDHILFEGFNIRNIKFINCSLEKCHFTSIHFEYCNFIECKLNMSEFANVTIYRCCFNNCNFTGSEIQTIDFEYSEIISCHFELSNVKRMVLNYSCFYLSDFYKSKLFDIDMYHSTLSNINFIYATFDNFKEMDSTIIDCDFDYAKDFPKNFKINCPEDGSFIGYKKAEIRLPGYSKTVILKLKITERSKRVSSGARACRCEEAEVLEIQNLDGEKTKETTAHSIYARNFKYEVGKIVKAGNFNDNKITDHAGGIYFFINRKDAVDYCFNF